MSWTEQRKLDYLLGLPWTIYTDRTADGERIVRVRELPSVTGSGVNDDEIERDFWGSLEATLRGYLHFGDEIPLPPLDVSLPWKQSTSTPAAPRRVTKDQPQGVDQALTAAVERWEEPELAKA